MHPYLLAVTAATEQSQWGPQSIGLVIGSIAAAIVLVAGAIYKGRLDRAKSDHAHEERIATIKEQRDKANARAEASEVESLQVQSHANVAVESDRAQALEAIVVEYKALAKSLRIDIDRLKTDVIRSQEHQSDELARAQARHDSELEHLRSDQRAEAARLQRFYDEQLQSLRLEIQGLREENAALRTRLGRGNS